MIVTQHAFHLRRTKLSSFNDEAVTGVVKDADDLQLVDLDVVHTVLGRGKSIQYKYCIVSIDKCEKMSILFILLK